MKNERMKIIHYANCGELPFVSHCAIPLGTLWLKGFITRIGANYANEPL